MCVIGSVGECERVENVLFTVARFVMCVLGFARRAYSVIIIIINMLMPAYQ